jgi:aconitase A
VRACVRVCTCMRACVRVCVVGAENTRQTEGGVCGHPDSGSHQQRVVPPNTTHHAWLPMQVYNFLSSAGAKYGVGFWKPGSGIIHQV